MASTKRGSDEGVALCLSVVLLGIKGLIGHIEGRKEGLQLQLIKLLLCC